MNRLLHTLYGGTFPQPSENRLSGAALDWRIPWEKRREMLMGSPEQLQSLPPSQQQAKRRALAEALLSVAPVAGEATSLRDAWDASGRGVNRLMGGDVSGALGEYGELALALAGAIPGVGMLGRAPRAFRRAMDIEIYPGKPVKVLQDPSPEEAREFIEATPYRAARVIDDPDTGVRYIWPADASAMHGQIAQKLGIRFDPSGPDAGKILTLD